MLIESLKLTFAILLPLITGYLLISLLSYKDKLDYLLKIGLSYGMGTGSLAILMILLGVLGFPFSQQVIMYPLFILLCVFFLFYRIKTKNYPSSLSILMQPKSPIEKTSVTVFLLRGFLLFIITLNLFFVFFRAFNLPVLSWDGLATVAFKAKIFYFEGYLPHLNKLPHPTYPLLVPFNETWIMLNLGRWSDELIKIIFPFALVSFLLVYYYFLKFFTNKTWALLGCVFLLSSDLLILHATISYRDFFLMYYNCITVMLLILWNQNKKSSFLIIASFFAGFASFTKLEGTAFFFIYLLIFLSLNFSDTLLSVRTKMINFFKFTIPVLCVLLPFQIYKIINGVLQDGVGANDKTALNLSLANLKLIPAVLRAFFKDMFISGNWSLTWLVLFVSLFLLKNKSRLTEIRILGVSILLFFSLYGSVALFTNNFLWIAGLKSLSGLSRLLLHFFPLTVLLIILLNFPNEKTQN